MQMKIFSFVVALLLITNLAAQDVIRLMIKGKKVGDAIVKEEPLVISVKKNKYKNISSLICIVKQKMRNDVFQRSISFSDSSGSDLYRVYESSKKGWYIINLDALRAKVLQLKMIKVFLQEDPANDRMAIRSSMKLLAEIYIQ